MSETHTSSNANKSQARITIPLPAPSLDDCAPSSHDSYVYDTPYNNTNHNHTLHNSVEENDDTLADEDEEFLEPTVKMPTLRNTAQPQSAIHRATTTTPLPAISIPDEPDMPVDEEQQAPTLKMPTLTRPLPTTPVGTDLSRPQADASRPLTDVLRSQTAIPINGHDETILTIPQLSELDVDNIGIDISVGTDLSRPLTEVSRPLTDVPHSLQSNGRDESVPTEAFDDFSELDIDDVAVGLIAITRKFPVTIKPVKQAEVQEELANEITEVEEITAEANEVVSVPMSTDDVQDEAEPGTIISQAADIINETNDKPALAVAMTTNTIDNIVDIVNDEIESLPIDDTVKDYIQDDIEVEQEESVKVDDIVPLDDVGTASSRPCLGIDILEPHGHDEAVPTEAFENSDSIAANSEEIAVLTAVQERDAEEEQPAPVMETPRPTWDAEQQLPPVTPVPPVYPEPEQTQQGRGHYYRRLVRAYWRSLFSSILIIVLLLNLLLLWQNGTSPHLLLGVLNAATGAVTARQDLGSISSNTLITNPLYGSSQVMIGIHANTSSGTQEVLALSGSQASWQIQSTLHVPQTTNSLSMTQDGHLLLENAQGMQVITPTGQQSWHIQGTQPTRGEHLFQPASDTRTVYSVQSANAGKIAAYNLQSGQVRWTHTVNDTLNYAPPLLLNGNTLYIASDHMLYALNSANGTQRWQVPYVARTLLLFHDTLIAAGAQGLTAFDAATGQVTWSFSGQMSNRLTPPQLYQAILANTNNAQPATIYTTGVVWQMPQAREQLWLYAVNANNGQVRWRQPVDSGFISADAGRTLLPVADNSDGLVMLQQQISTNEQRISAFATINGSPRWQINLSNSTRSAPALLKTPDGSILYFTTTTGVSSIIRTFSLTRTLFLLFIILSMVGLILLWSLPRAQARQRLHYIRKLINTSNHTVQQRMVTSIQRVRRWHPTPVQILAIVLPLLACISTLLYSLFNSPQTMMTLINTTTGNRQWVHVTNSATQPLGTNGQYSVIETELPGQMRQIEVLNASGTVLWHSFASEGQFSVPVLTANAQTLLVALHGPTTLPYQYAPADPAYPPATHGMLAFYQFASNDGHIVWSHIAAYPGLGQNVSIPGTDSTYIYVVGTPASSATTTIGNLTAGQLQLFAVNQQTGNVDWHIFGPSVAPNVTHDAGILLFDKRQVIWQIDGNIYAIDPLMGQIEWRRSFSPHNTSTIQHEGQQMVITANALLVAGSKNINALDITSGNLLWSLPIQNAHAMTLAANDQIMVVATGNTLRAYALSDQHQLWEQQTGTVQRLQADSQNVYVLVMNDATPKVTAMNMRNGAVQWTHTLMGGSVLAHSGFLLSHSSLFIGICQSTNCTNAQLTLLRSDSGTVRWQTTAQQMSGALFSQDETHLLVGDVGTRN